MLSLIGRNTPGTVTIRIGSRLPTEPR
jgi:hypothetical protein